MAASLAHDYCSCKFMRKKYTGSRALAKSAGVRFQYHRRDRTVLKRVNAIKKIAITAKAKIQICIF
jgi:hypothetical protein